MNCVAQVQSSAFQSMTLNLNFKIRKQYEQL